MEGERKEGRRRRMNGWMDGWMDGWMCVCVSSTLLIFLKFWRCCVALCNMLRAKSPNTIRYINIEDSTRTSIKSDKSRAKTGPPPKKVIYAAATPTFVVPKDLPNPRRKGGPVPFPVVIFNRFLLAAPPLSSPCPAFSSTQAIFSMR